MSCSSKKIPKWPLLQPPCCMQHMPTIDSCTRGGLQLSMNTLSIQPTPFSFSDHKTQKQNLNTVFQHASGSQDIFPGHKHLTLRTIVSELQVSVLIILTGKMGLRQVKGVAQNRTVQRSVRTGFESSLLSLCLDCFLLLCNSPSH